MWRQKQRNLLKLPRLLTSFQIQRTTPVTIECRSSFTSLHTFLNQNPKKGFYALCARATEVEFNENIIKFDYKASKTIMAWTRQCSLITQKPERLPSRSNPYHEQSTLMLFIPGLNKKLKERVANFSMSILKPKLANIFTNSVVHQLLENCKKIFAVTIKRNCVLPFLWKSSFYFRSSLIQYLNSNL